MSKKEIKDLTIVATLGNQHSNLGGQTVSINLKNERVFVHGPLELDESKYWGVIPDGQSMAYYKVIEDGLKMGLLVLGKVRTQAVDRDPGVPSEYWTLLKNKGANDKSVVEKFRKLIKGNGDRFYTVYEVVDFCERNEKKSRNSPVTLNFLKEVRKFATGPYSHIKAYDDSSDVQEVIVDTKAGVAYPKGQDPKGPTATPAQANTALGKLLD